MFFNAKRASFTDSLNASYDRLQHAGLLILSNAAQTEETIRDSLAPNPSTAGRIALATAASIRAATHAALLTAWVPATAARFLISNTLSPGLYRDYPESTAQCSHGR